MTCFVFDLDGTITQLESLPYLASAFGLGEEMQSLTTRCIAGEVPFVESLRYRVAILQNIPVSQARALLHGIPLYPKLVRFITENRDHCVIATSNLDCWVSSLLQCLACPWQASTAIVKNDKLLGIDLIPPKEALVSQLQAQGHRVIFIGDGYNDLEAMRKADVAIAAGMSHPPAPALFSVAKHVATSEKDLSSLLQSFL